MGNAKALINGQQHPGTSIALVIDETARELEIDGLDYSEAAEASLYLPPGGEAKLIRLLGRDHFERSFDLHVTFAPSQTARRTQDRLVDCRLRETGSRPVRLSVMFAKHDGWQ